MEQSFIANEIFQISKIQASPQQHCSSLPHSTNNLIDRPTNIYSLKISAMPSINSNGLTEKSILRMEQSYRPINDHEAQQEISETKKAKRILYFSGLTFLIFVCGLLFLSKGQDKVALLKSSGPSDSFLSGKCAPCTFIQCKADLCDAVLDPYQCTSGGALNGCTVNEETWSKSGVCNECCSAVDCKKTVAAGNTDDDVAACGDCSPAQCSKLAAVSSQSCHDAAPYVCVEGSSRMGCSADPYHWAAMVETQCRSAS